MVRNQRFVLSLLLISSVAFTGCANTRSRFASLWRRGADDSFSESIVDNRKMPKSAREMADSVQDSLRDSADELDESAESLADSAKSKSGELSEKSKRYSESTDTRIDELDNRIDDVVARAKARNAATNPRVRSDFPEDPFLSEFDALAEKSPVKSGGESDPVLDRLAGAKQKLAASRDPFSDDKDVAEPLIAKVEKTAEQTVDDAFDDANPFESLATTDGTKESPSPAVDQPEPEKTPTRTTKEAVAANKEVPVDELANEFPDLEFPVADDEPAVAKRVAKVVADDADEFDLMFAEAKPVVEKAKQTFQENSFRTASALQDKSDSETNVFGDRVATPAKNAAEPRELKDDFDRMIVDSDELPQKTALQPKRSANVTPDEFTGANQQLDTYDDFFEVDNSVRANEPGDATQRDSNPFSFAEPVRETNTVPAMLTPATPVPEPVDPPESDLVSPFENLDEVEEPDEVELPVAETGAVSPFDSASEPSTHSLELVAQPAGPAALTVIPASGNSATANGVNELNAVSDAVTGPEFELAATDSQPQLAPAGELPEIVPGDAGASAFSNEPYVDLSAVTQTPLENVAWEVEPDTSAGPGAGRTSPWIAWIAVALCSIALILLLRPATNRIS